MSYKYEICYYTFFRSEIINVKIFDTNLYYGYFLSKDRLLWQLSSSGTRKHILIVLLGWESFCKLSHQALRQKHTHSQ